MKIVFTPDWFLASDVIIEAVTLFVLILFLFLTYRSYKISKNRSTFYLGLGFLMIALAELSTIFTKLVLYYDIFFSEEIGKIIVSNNVASSVDIFYYIGFFFYKLLTLLGFYVIYRIPLKRKVGRDLWLALCFILISALFSATFYYLFYLTTFIFLLLILINYSEVYRKNKSANTGMLVWAFGLLAFSHGVFILSKLPLLYALAQIAQLVSYIILVFLAIRITQHGREKKK